MTTSYNLYKSQYKKAKETLDVLINNRTKIELKLESDPISSTLHKELRNVILDIKITQNELEQAESDVKQCEL
jgi:outer membrane protein TolC